MTGSPTRAQVFGVVIGSGWRAGRKWMVHVGGLLVAEAVCSVLYPVGYAVVVDAYLRHATGELVAGVGLIAGLYAARWVLAMLAGTGVKPLGDHVALYLSQRIAELVSSVPGVEHLERPDYLAELDLLNENRRLLASGPQQGLLVLQVLVRTLGVIVILTAVYPPLALLPLFGIAPFLGERRSVRLRQACEDKIVEEKRLADELFELAATAAPAKELRLYGLEGELIERHDSLARTVVGNISSATVRGALWSSLGWVVFAAGFVGGVATLALRAVHGAASAGEVVLAVALVQRTQAQVGQLGNASAQLLTMTTSARRLLWLENYCSHTAAQHGEHPPPIRLVHGITLQDVAFRYPKGDADVLSGVNLSLPAGSSVAIVGENGAGKSTLVKLLTGMYEPTAGQVLIDGVPLADIDLGRWRARTAALFQDFSKLELLARETIGVGDLPRIEDRPAIDTAIGRSDAGSLVATLGKGLETPVGASFSGGTDLSGGQWQRLALARTMMRDDPLLLILDEPAASLDPLAEAALFDRYAEAAANAATARGTITLMISHRFSTVRQAELIVVLDGGRIVETGSHDQLLRSGGVYSELYNLQARSYRA